MANKAFALAHEMSSASVEVRFVVLDPRSVIVTGGNIFVPFVYDDSRAEIRDAIIAAIRDNQQDPVLRVVVI